jgi:metal-responsive CopG/Arc/MetJ family transcriptional regulator
MANRTKVRLNVDLPPALLDELKERCRFRGEMGWLVEQAIREYLVKGTKKNGKKNKEV